MLNLFRRQRKIAPHQLMSTTAEPAKPVRTAMANLPSRDDRRGLSVMAQGRTQAALQSFHDGRDISDRLAKADRGKTGLQRDLALSFARLADAFSKVGDKTAALDASRKDHEIVAHMTAPAPDQALWKCDIAWFDQQFRAWSGDGLAPRDRLERHSQ